jgi:hypothetical protein
MTGEKHLSELYIMHLLGRYSPSPSIKYTRASTASSCFSPPKPRSLRCQTKSKRRRFQKTRHTRRFKMRAAITIDGEPAAKPGGTARVIGAGPHNATAPWGSCHVRLHLSQISAPQCYANGWLRSGMKCNSIANCIKPLFPDDGAIEQRHFCQWRW